MTADSFYDDWPIVLLECDFLEHFELDNVALSLRNLYDFLMLSVLLFRAKVN